ncbi:uncharacterized protein LOC113229792 [Hyposmocoma kahamanoa]|uniref:uncharacterized protein LOC113229792 n=1 Tax=Hyposmocoma kahamanoa TaxID=1477025 RepID=UPI000E6D94DF|nr:uncharacterized protein LOC113229792 [Hyposmocoma kahamanoa]
MDEESIRRICTTSFSTVEVTEAKKLLCDSIPSKVRRITRKGEGKSQRDIEDIICLFKETDPDLTPIFVARDLNKLPPITFDYVDASKLLRDINLLQRDLKLVQDAYVSKQEYSKLRIELDALKSASLVNNFNNTCNFNENLNVNQRLRGAYLLNNSDVDSGPMGINFSDIGESRNPEVDLKIGIQRTQVMDAAVPSVCDESPARPMLASPPVPEPRQAVCDVSDQLSAPAKKTCFSSAFVAEANVDKGNEWITVINNKKKSKRYENKIGLATQLSNFKSANLKVPIFLSNVHKDTKPEAISDYVYKQTNEKISLIEIAQRKERGYNAFKMFVPRHKLYMFLEEKLWPEGVIFRRFINFNYQVKHRVEASKPGQNEQQQRDCTQ